MVRIKLQNVKYRLSPTNFPAWHSALADLGKQEGHNALSPKIPKVVLCPVDYNQSCRLQHITFTTFTF